MEVYVLKGKCQYKLIRVRDYFQSIYKYFFRFKSEDKMTLIHLLNLPPAHTTLSLDI